MNISKAVVAVKTKEAKEKGINITNEVSISDNAFCLTKGNLWTYLLLNGDARKGMTDDESFAYYVDEKFKELEK